MVGAGYLADQGRKAGPLLTVMCAAVFLASGLAAVFEALTLSQEADTLERAPVCGPSRVPADCRLHLGGIVVGGYDEGSGLTPERHIDVKASNGDVLHLGSPIVGTPPQIGSSVELEYWKGKLVRFATTAGSRPGTIRAACHGPAGCWHGTPSVWPVSLDRKSVV